MHQNLKARKEVKEIVNISRSKKKIDLTKEFDEFKQRIQQFENKNEQIINRIREAYTVKKKVINHNYTEAQTQPYFQHQNANNDSLYVASSCDYSKNVVYDGNVFKQNQQSQINYGYQTLNQQRYMPNLVNQKVAQNYSIKSNKPNEPAHFQVNYEDYMRNMQLINKIKSEEQSQGIMMGNQRKKPSQLVHQQQHYLQLQQRLKEAIVKNQQLQEANNQQKNEINRIKNYQSKFKLFASHLKHVVEDNIESYHEEVISEGFSELEKHIKKCENKIKNLSFRLKDQIEDRKAKKAIRKSRERRNTASKNKARQNSNSISSIDMKQSRDNLGKEADNNPNKLSRTYSQSKVKNRNQNASKQKEFEEIAAAYENMVKAKADEIDKLEKHIREEIKCRETAIASQQKMKIIIQQKDKIIADLKRIRKPVKQDSFQPKETKQLEDKVTKLEEELKRKQFKQRQYNETIQKLQKSKKSLHQQYNENINKNRLLKAKSIQQLQTKLKDAEIKNQVELAEVKERLMLSDKKILEKDCEMLALLNKLKKAESECTVKEEKLKELSNILLRESDHGDLLEKSMSIDNSILSQADVKHMQQSIRKLEEEVEEKDIYIYDLQKAKAIIENINKEFEQENMNILKDREKLEQRVQQLMRQVEDICEDENKGQNKQLNERNELIQQLQAERHILIEEKEEIAIKNSELIEQLKRIKDLNLNSNRELIKLTSEYNFSKGQLSELEQKYCKIKEQLAELKLRLAEQKSVSQQKCKKFEEEVSNYIGEIQALKIHIESMESANHNEKEDDNLLNSLHSSEVSFYKPHKFNEEEATLLKQKLKEMEATLQIKESMEQQIKNQYHNNLDRIKSDLSSKSRQIQKQQSQIQNLRNELNIARKSCKEDQSFQIYKKELYEDKIIQLEEDYNAVKNSEERLNEMLHEIVENVKSKDEEHEKLIKELQEKERIIEEFKEKGDNRLIRQSSLRISGDYSEEIGEEFSFLSNISDVFKKDDILQERIKKGRTSREEQVKLFAKTAAYIKALKNLIESKDKRIKMLEKQLASMKASSNKGWSQKQKSISERVYSLQDEEDIEECDEYKDYDSVQLDTKRWKYYEQSKKTEHEKNLVVEENKILSKQIEIFQEDLLKAEEQQNNLIKLKDLYKDEMKNLMEKNEIHTKEFEIQIKLLNDKLQQSENYHNLEAIKQLFVKVIGAVSFLDDPTTKAAKRDEKRKQLEQYIKVMCSIMHIDNNTQDRLIASIKK